MKKHTIKSDYLYSIYTIKDYKKLVKKAVALIKAFRVRHKFDAIAFTGTSGAALAYPLSIRLDLPLICIRKEDNNHYRMPIEGCVSAEKYIIIDDFISGGNTMRKITETIKKQMPKAKPVAIFLYGAVGSSTHWNKIPIKKIASYYG